MESPLVLILIFACFLAFFLGDALDAYIILSIVLISVLLGFFQEYKSEKVLSELKKYFSYRAVVVRNGEKSQIDSTELVPGDVITVGLGDIVPADLRIIESRMGVVVNESVLTGESRAVGKNAANCTSSCASPQEITNGLFIGKTITEGYAVALVVATGKNTFFGKTASVFSSRLPESDFQTGIRKFGSLLVKVIVVITLFVFLANFYLGHGDKNPLLDSALFALALAVGIAPEALPAIITLTLSMGSMKLAKKKVITKKLAAIEDLGNMDILCTDKTGTLTEEGLRFFKYVDLDLKDSHDVFEYALLCNSAVGSTRIRGNPIDVAIKKHGQEARADISHFLKMQDIPFDFERRRMSVIVQEGKTRYLISKGAPESIFQVCSHIKMNERLYPSGEKEREINKMISNYNKDGLSTIGVAYKEIGTDGGYSKQDEKGMIFIGFVLFSNPPKATVHQTLTRLKHLNIRLKILTGDDALVTKKLCDDIMLTPAEGRILTGSELAKMDEKEFEVCAERFDVFARVAPEQKLKIVEALRKNGHVVGFLGDGINDAPAIRAADVGISVDTASDVAKGASHLILLKKSLGVICDGVEEGRKIFGNITKYILNTISANQGNMITISLSSLFLPFIPLLPAQILLNNLISDLPMFAISTDNVDATYTKKPQRWNMGLIFRFMLFFGLISSVFDLLFIGLSYYVFRFSIPHIRTGWFLLSVLTEIVVVFSLRTQFAFWKSRPSQPLIVASLAAIALSLAVIYFAPTAEIFRFEALSFKLFLLIAGLIAAYFAATEIGKRIFFEKFALQPK